MPIQINTLVSRETADDLPAIYVLLKTHKGDALESVFLNRGRPWQTASACLSRAWRAINALG